MPLTVMTGLLAKEIANLSDWEIFSAAVTGESGTAYNWSSGGEAYVMYPDGSVQQVAALMLQMLGDEELAAESVQ